LSLSLGAKLLDLEGDYYYNKTMRKLRFQNGSYYHIFNRGANKANIFFSDKDRYKFLWILESFNDSNANFASVRLKEVNLGAKLLEKDKLVDILCFVLMPNHFHLLLRQRKDDGISKFMHKLGTSYTNCINLKHEHSGALFQGSYKAVEVESDEQLLHLSRYIHLNPVELMQPGWKEEGIKNLRTVRGFLNDYKWSSYARYIGKDGLEFSKIIEADNLINNLIPIKKYQKFVEDWFIKVNLSKELLILGAKLLES